MRVENHYLLIQLHSDFKVGSKENLQCYRLNCNFIIILFTMVPLNERCFVNVICNHSIPQSYPAIADCHYQEKAGLLEFK